MLGFFRINPKLSAYAFLFDEFDFNATPLVPPGTHVVSHAKPEVRASWQPNGEVGWYVGPSMQHYRCVNTYFPTTRAGRNVDTVIFFQQRYLFLN